MWLMAAASMLVVTFTGCKKDKYTELKGVCPEVIATDPANLATGVAPGQVITATFNEAMDPATITAASFSLRGTVPVSGTVTYDEATATLRFVPDILLAPNTTYSATVYTNVRDLAGSALQTDHSWTFSTGDSLSPMIISTDPADQATGVPPNKTVAATFSMPMSPASINAATFTLKRGTSSIAGTVSYSGTTALFDPVAALASNTLYTATITTGAKNAAGTSIAGNYTWTFRTLDSLAPYVTVTDPLNNATGVPLGKVVRATFSMAMDPLTVNATTFTLKSGASTLPGVITFNGNTASFAPAAPLASNTLYTATITTGAKSTTGVFMTSNYVWTFRTLDTLSPKVISTDPANAATGVAPNKVVRATFNQAMDPLTITTATFTMKQGITAVAGTVSYNSITASFTPAAALAANTLYTCTITTGAKNLAGIPLAANYVWSFRTLPATTGVDLKSVSRFGIIAGVGVTNNAGFSEIRNMDVGISPGVRSSITGFPPAIIVNGAIYASDDIAPPGVAAMLTQAKQDLTDAYLYAESATFPAPATVSGDLGGTTLAPGIYKSTSTLLIQSGNLTLDAQGDPNAVWIFQVASDFTTVGGAGGSVILSGGAQAKNVFWQTGSSATIGDNTSFKGNVLALTSITLNSGAVAEGRMLARNGSVVMTNTNIISKP